MLETPFWIFCTGVIDSTGALPVYDVLEIKKKRASPVRNNPYPVKPHFLYDKYNNTSNDTCHNHGCRTGCDGSEGRLNGGTVNATAKTTLETKGVSAFTGLEVNGGNLTAVAENASYSNSYGIDCNK